MRSRACAAHPKLISYIACWPLHKSHLYRPSESAWENGSFDDPQYYLNRDVDRVNFLPHELYADLPPTEPGYYQLDQFPDLLSGLRAQGADRAG